MTLSGAPQRAEFWYRRQASCTAWSDMRLCTWNVKSLLHTGTLISATRYLTESNLNLHRCRWPCGLGRSAVGIAGSNPAESKDVHLLCCCVGSGLCDELITHSEESFGVCVCVMQRPQKRGSLGRHWAVAPQIKIKFGSETYDEMD